MQNKPNFRKSQMNLKFCKQMDYEYKRDWTIGQNKPNSNPISKKPKWMYTHLQQRITEKKMISQSEKTNPISETPKMNVNLTLTKDYRKNDALASKKTNPIQTQSS